MICFDKFVEWDYVNFWVVDFLQDVIVPVVGDDVVSWTLVQIHFVYFVKPVLVKDTGGPQAVQFLVQALCIVLVQHLAQFVETAFATVGGKHPKQMYLSLIECGCRFHN